ncbi:MAG TPA: radical SAM protein [Clostridiales bacterium]|nr:radical SAM protein [Clostridiales bacterium]HQP68878.1 radical SAM protein [Clostridiales bacterium]
MILKVNEIFESLQGESSYAGLPCVFVRLTGCNLRCEWCDTKYAYSEGTYMSPAEVAERINSSKALLAEFTGGEPLLQIEALIEAVNLIDESKTILVETNGSIPIAGLPDRIINIVDIKLNGSGESGSFLEDNLKYLSKKDEIKFVLKNIIDYNEFKEYYLRFRLEERCNVLVSKVKGSEISHRDIAEMILKDGLKVRYQIQLHKSIWGDERGK